MVLRTTANIVTDAIGGSVGSMGVEHALALPAGMSMYAQSEEGGGASATAASLAGAGRGPHDSESGMEDSWSSQVQQGGPAASGQPRSQQPSPQHAAGALESPLACCHASGS